MPNPNNPCYEWICKKCNKKTPRHKSEGRPLPSKCPKNNNQDHVWVKNKEL